jgi:hypothetical protein
MAVAVPLAAKALRRANQQMQARHADNSWMGASHKPSKLDMLSGRGQSRYAGSRW